MEQNNYLGQEKVGRLLLKFAIPSTLALIIMHIGQNAHSSTGAHNIYSHSRTFPAESN